MRIAVPKPEQKRFVVDYVHVPFGSFIIRSGALFHSGHYGSPGNTRLHSIVFDMDSQTNTKNLGYMDRITRELGWETVWADDILKSSEDSEADFTLAEHVMDYTNKVIGGRKRSGTGYFNSFKDDRYDGFDTYMFMLNPCMFSVAKGVKNESVHDEEGVGAGGAGGAAAVGAVGAATGGAAAVGAAEESGGEGQDPGSAKKRKPIKVRKPPVYTPFRKPTPPAQPPTTTGGAHAPNLAPNPSSRTSRSSRGGLSRNKTSSKKRKTT